MVFLLKVSYILLPQLKRKHCLFLDDLKNYGWHSIERSEGGNILMRNSYNSWHCMKGSGNLKEKAGRKGYDK